MRYLVVTYYKKANGQIDEVMAVAKNLKKRDLDTSNVILDFKTLSVVKATSGGVNIDKDFDTIVQYYIQHYQNIVTRLFQENGFTVDIDKNEKNIEAQPSEANPS